MTDEAEEENNQERSHKPSKTTSSQWQVKYGGGPRQELEQDDVSLTAWLASIDRRETSRVGDADAAGGPEDTSFGPLFLSDAAPAESDEEAESAEVVAQMNALLNGETAEADFSKIDLPNSFDIDDGECIDFAYEFRNFQLPGIDDGDPLVKRAGNHDASFTEEAFSGENMAILFRRSHDEKILRKCFDCLSSHAQSTKLLRCRAFEGWKRVARNAKISYEQLIRRTRRRHKVRRIRRILSAWLSISHERCILVQEGYAWRTKSKVFISWRRMVRRERSRREEAKVRVETAQRIKKADNFCQSKLKRSFFTGWLAVTEASRSETGAAEEAGQDSVAVIEAAKDNTPTKQTPKATCITPERKAMPPEESVCNVKACGGDKENRLPNRQPGNKLLRPLKHQRPKPPRNQSTPKLVLEMEERKAEREKRRGVLRKKYEQKAVEKQKRLERERQEKENAEMREHQEFMQQKAEEERRKQVAASRWKQACRLAVLHYRMTLQRRMLLQWKKIFQIKAFNERKVRNSRITFVFILCEGKDILQINIYQCHDQAIQLWSDTMYEKCWQRWKVYKDEQLTFKREQLLRQQQLADDFNQRRLLAKSFAALEEHCHYTQSLVGEAQLRVAAQRRRVVFSKWHRITIETNKGRNIREARAAEHGRRLLLFRAMEAWQSGVTILQEEREMNMLIAAKWEEVNKWLETA